VKPASTATRERPGQPEPQFQEFNATELYCPQCGRAMPVRPRLFLVLPEGDRYTYHCANCGEALGEKMVRGAARPGGGFVA